MYLAKTAIEKFWDKDDEILFLGPWCMDYSRKDVWQQLNYTLLPNPWEQRADLDTAWHITQSVYDRMMDKLTDTLNDIHGSSHDRRYWELLTGAWLKRFIHATYDRFVTIKKAYELYPDLKTHVLDDKCFITPQNAYHFNDLYFGDFYNLQLCSQIITALGYKHPAVEYIYTSQQGQAGIGRTIKNTLLAVYKSVFNLLSRRKKYLLFDMYLSRTHLWKLMLKAGGQVGNYEQSWKNYAPNTNDCYLAAREKLSRIDIDGEYEKVLVSLFAVNFPKAYIEGYRVLQKRTLNKWRKFPKALMTSIGWYFNEEFKFLAAEAQSRGTKLIGYQHGGGYGVGKIKIEEHERHFADHYFSWGWMTKDEQGEVSVLPNPRLTPEFSEMELRNASLKRDVLFVGTNHPRYTYYLYSVPMNRQFDEYISLRNVFLDHCSESLRRRMIFRLYGNHYGRHDAERLKDQFGALRFDTGKKKLKQQLKNVRCAVVDHPMTSHLEILSWNFPLIIYRDPNAWETRKEVADYYQDLKRANILFDSPQEAAQHLEAIYDQPLNWWLSEEVQEVRRRFIYNFAYGEKNWTSNWLLQLKHLEEKLEQRDEIRESDKSERIKA